MPFNSTITAIIDYSILIKRCSLHLVLQQLLLSYLIEFLYYFCAILLEYMNAIMTFFIDSLVQGLWSFHSLIYPNCHSIKRNFIGFIYSQLGCCLGLLLVGKSAFSKHLLLNSLLELLMLKFKLLVFHFNCDLLKYLMVFLQGIWLIQGNIILLMLNLLKALNLMACLGILVQILLKHTFANQLLQQHVGND